MVGYLCPAMKKLSLILLLTFSVHYLQGQVDQDKALHFLGGNLYGLAGAGIAKQISDGNRWWTFVGAIGGSTLIGLGKEAVDSGQRENGWDNDDLLATILGGATVGVTIDIFTDHKRDTRKRKGSLTVEKKHDRSEQFARLDMLLKKQKPPTLWALSLPEELVNSNSLE